MILAFAVPTLLVLWNRGTLGPWALWTGLVLGALGVGLAYFIWKTQRVDHARRAEAGLEAGIANPNDPAPDDLRR